MILIEIIGKVFLTLVAVVAVLFVAGLIIGVLLGLFPETDEKRRK